MQRLAHDALISLVRGWNLAYVSSVCCAICSVNKALLGFALHWQQNLNFEFLVSSHCFKLFKNKSLFPYLTQTLFYPFIMKLTESWEQSVLFSFIVDVTTLFCKHHFYRWLSDSTPVQQRDLMITNKLWVCCMNKAPECRKQYLHFLHSGSKHTGLTCCYIFRCSVSPWEHMLWGENT